MNSHSDQTLQTPKGRPISKHKAVTRFMGDLPSDAEARSAHTFEQLIEFGHDPRYVDVEHIEGDLWELKVNNPKPNRLRLRYFFVVKNDVYLFTHAYIKQTNKAPRQEIKLALRRAYE